MLTAFKKLLGKFARKKDGSVLIEFVVLVPVFIIMLGATAEIGRYILVQKKIHKMAFEIGALASRSSLWSTNDINALSDVARDIMYPFDDGDMIASLEIVTSAINRDVGDSTRMVWQVDYNTGGVSDLGDNVGGTVQLDQLFNPLPNGTPFDLREGESIYVTEVQITFSTYTFSNTFLDLFSPGAETIRHFSFSRPRSGEMIEPLS